MSDRDRELEVGAFEDTYKDKVEGHGSFTLRSLCEHYQAKLMKLTRDMKSGRSQRIKENTARFHAAMLANSEFNSNNKEKISALALSHAVAHEEAYEVYMTTLLQLPDDLTQLKECIDFFEVTIGRPDDKAAADVFKHARRLVSLVAMRLGFTR